MVQVDFDSLRGRDLAIDLENGTDALIYDEGSRDANATNFVNRVWNGFVSSYRSNKSEENVSLGSCRSIEAPVENGEVLVDKRYGGEEASPLEKKVAGEKPKKKSCKKPPKPPRPPRASSLDAVDQKLIREFNEIAMMKRARIERMKAMKRTKNAKSASSGSNFFALIITVVFCFVIIWQGLFPRGGSNMSLQGSPESSLGARGGFISVQFYKNVSTQDDSSSASPNNVELMSGLDERGEASKETRYAAGSIYRSED